MSVLDHLLLQAKNQPDRIFLQTEQGSYTYQEFGSRVARFAGYLRANYNVAPGERIMLCFPNDASYLITYFACWYLGATVIPVDFDSREYTLEHIINQAEPKLIVHANKRSFFETKGRILPFPNEQEYISLPECERVPFPVDIPALIMFTSGTTGVPKGVMLSHETLLFTARRIIEWSGMCREDIELTTLRLSHSFGLGHIHCYILLGAQVVMLESMSDANRFFDYLSRFNVTGIPATPAVLRILLNYHKTKFQAIGSKLAYIIINTSPISEELLQQLMELLPNTRVFMYYGLTEASRSTYIAYKQQLNKLGSVGTPPVGVEIKIDGSSNEILVHGENLMMGYLNQTESFRKDGWFATGDLGRLDEEGFLYVTGRLKDQINVDGLKIDPYEVEKVLGMHQAVKECVVFGIDDAVTHEKVVSAIICHSSFPFTSSLVADLRRHCKKFLEIHKIPREIKEWPELPYTDSGKLKRAEARQMWERSGML